MWATNSDCRHQIWLDLLGARGVQTYWTTFQEIVCRTHKKQSRVDDSKFITVLTAPLWLYIRTWSGDCSDASWQHTNYWTRKCVNDQDMYIAAPDWWKNMVAKFCNAQQFVAWVRMDRQNERNLTSGTDPIAQVLASWMPGLLLYAGLCGCCFCSAIKLDQCFGSCRHHLFCSDVRVFFLFFLLVNTGIRTSISVVFLGGAGVFWWGDPLYVPGHFTKLGF